MKVDNPGALHDGLQTLAHLLIQWSKGPDSDSDSNAISRELNGDVPGPQFNQLSKQFARFARGREDSIELDVHGQLIPGPEVSTHPATYPVLGVALRREGDHVDVALRTALLYRDDEGRTWAHGWRFETPDWKAGEGQNPNPYPHAQAINSWRPGLDGFRLGSGATVPSAHPALERRPAFPLRGSGSPVSLAVSMIATLHGVPWTERLLGPGPNVKLGDKIRKETDQVVRMLS